MILISNLPMTTYYHSLGAPSQQLALAPINCDHHHHHHLNNDYNFEIFRAPCKRCFHLCSMTARIVPLVPFVCGAHSCHVFRFPSSPLGTNFALNSFTHGKITDTILLSSGSVCVYFKLFFFNYHFKLLAFVIAFSFGERR